MALEKMVSKSTLLEVHGLVVVLVLFLLLLTINNDKFSDDLMQIIVTYEDHVTVLGIIGVHGV